MPNLLAPAPEGLWESMPDHQLLSVLQFLEAKDLCRSSQVCHQWRRVSRDEFLWRDLLYRNFSVHADIGMAPGHQSWLSEYRRLCDHIPLELTSTLTGHRDEVLHVRFSHSAKYFATSAKDGFVKVWSSEHPCTLVYSRDMKEYFWQYTQYTEFSADDSLLLVSGVHFGINSHNPSTSGEIAVFNFNEGFELQCRVQNKPYDVFGTWYNANYLISGNLSYLGHFSSCSTLYLNKASQELDNAWENVVMQFYKFHNLNASTVRNIQVCDCPREKTSQKSTKKMEQESTKNTEQEPTGQRKRKGEHIPGNSSHVHKKEIIINSPHKSDFTLQMSNDHQVSASDECMMSEEKEKSSGCGNAKSPCLSSSSSSNSLVNKYSCDDHQIGLSKSCDLVLHEQENEDSFQSSFLVNVDLKNTNEDPTTEATFKLPTSIYEQTESTSHELGDNISCTANLTLPASQRLSNLETETSDLNLRDSVTQQLDHQYTANYESQQLQPVSEDIFCSELEVQRKEVFGNPSKKTKVDSGEEYGVSDESIDTFSEECTTVLDQMFQTDTPQFNSMKEITKRPEEEECDKYLIFTCGSLTYTPHQIGIKRISHQDAIGKFQKLSKERWIREQHLKIQHKKQLAREMENNQQQYDYAPEADDDEEWSSGDEAPPIAPSGHASMDDIDRLIEMNGHIIGIHLSPDNRYLYVNIRCWPENCFVLDPLDPPPITSQIEIRVIDLLTLEDLGVRHRSHKAYTANDECFFIFLDVNEEYVASGAEDKFGYLWDRHYRSRLAKYPHDNVVNSVALTTVDPEVMVTVSDDHKVKVWRSRNRCRQLGIDTSLLITADHHLWRKKSSQSRQNSQENSAQNNSSVNLVVGEQDKCNGEQVGVEGEQALVNGAMEEDYLPLVFQVQELEEREDV